MHEISGNPRKPPETPRNPRETVGKPRETLQKLNKHERKPCGNPFIRTGFTLWQFTKVRKGQVQETCHPITARQCQYYPTGRPLEGEGRKRCSSASGEDLCQPERRSWGTCLPYESMVADRLRSTSRLQAERQGTHWSFTNRVQKKEYSLRLPGFTVHVTTCYRTRLTFCLRVHVRLNPRT